MRKHLKLAVESETNIAAIAQAAAAETGTPDAAAAATSDAASSAASDAKGAEADLAAPAGAEHTPAGDHAAESPLATHAEGGEPVIGASPMGEELGADLELHPELLEDQPAADQMEDSLDVAATDADATVGENEEAGAVLESLHNTMAQVRELVKSRQCSPATLALATESIDVQLRRLGMQLPAISLESEIGIEQAHCQLILATESVAGRIGQEIVVGWKHQWNAVADFFRTIDGQIGKYSKKLQAAETEWHGTSAKVGNGPFKASLGGLWYHFATDKGQVTNVVAAVEADLKYSKYLLVDYPTQVLAVVKAQMSKLVTLKNLHDPMELEKAAKELLEHKPAFELFDQHMLSEGFPLLSVVGLRVKEGSKPKAIGPGEVYERLAAAEQVRYVYEQGSLKHFGKKVLGNHVGGMLSHVAIKSIQYSAADIAKLIELSKKYLEYAEEYRKIERALGSMYENLWNFVAENEHQDGEYVYGRADSRMLMGLYETVWNSFICAWHPGMSECRRAVKAAKYGHYAALRMMHHAVNGD